MKVFVVIDEPGPRNRSAHVPDLPRCVATVATPEDTERSIRQANELHARRMRENDLPVPDPA